jgi:hypothetical protein
MQLPSPKAYDPDAIEQTNLALFKDPYTVDRASLNADLFRSERMAGQQQYQHGVAAQQDYYNRALQAQANESAMELIPKMLHETHGIGIMSGIPEIRRVLEDMAGGPELYNQYVNQSFQTEKAKALQAGGAGAYSAIQAGLATPPSEFAGATGVNTQQVTPLSVQTANINAASGGGEGGSGNIRFNAGFPPVVLPDGRTMVPTASFKSGTTQEQLLQEAERSGMYKPGTNLQPNTSAQPGQPSGKQGLPAQQQRQGGNTSAAPPNRNAEWDAVKTKLPPEMVANVERARKMNNGNVIIDPKRRVMVGNDAQGNVREYPIRG